MALLPLPLAAGINRQTDLVVVLALLEWPRILTIALELQADIANARIRAAQRLATALNSYPPLILATLVLALAAGSFEIGALVRPPDELLSARMALLHWLGATTWVLALPPALEIGPFVVGPAEHRALRTGLGLRMLGLVACATLPWFPLLSAPHWLLPLPPLLVAALVWGYHQISAGQSSRRWARGYLAFDLGLLLVLFLAAFLALQARLG